MKSRCCEVSFEAGKLHLFYLKDKAACHERCSHTVIITYCLRTITPLVGRIGLKLFFFFFKSNKQGNFVLLDSWFKFNA